MSDLTPEPEDDLDDLYDEPAWDVIEDPEGRPIVGPSLEELLGEG